MIPAKYWSPTKKLMLLGAMAGGKTVEATALGNPLAFTTDLARPLRSLLIPFTPVQSGTGDPSPQNIRPIVPWNGLTVFGGGKNLIPTGTVTFNRAKKYYFDKVLPAGTYTFSALVTSTDTDTSRCLIRFWLNEHPVGNDIYFTRGTRETAKVTITEPFNSVYLYSSDSYVHTEGDSATFTDIQLESGSVATAYEPYQPITETDISFPSPVYGGEHEAVSGALSGTWGAKKVKDIEWTYNAQNTRFVGTIDDIKLYPAVRTTPFYASVFVSVDDGRGISSVPNNAVYGGTNSTTIYVKCEDYTDPEDFVTAYGEQVICYPLENPQTVQLAQKQIRQLVGQNTMWSDADGQMTAVYLKKG